MGDSNSGTPDGSESLSLDDRLRHFLNDTDPPSTAGVDVDTLLRASEADLRRPALPRSAGVLKRQVSAQAVMSAVQTEQRRPTPAPLTPEQRAATVTKELETTGPGQEAPGVQALLRLGPRALPVIAEAFPGLLWFNRRHPHRAVPRGRDVSPIARAFIAFGADSVPFVIDAMRANHPDIRFYALLVALELDSEALIEPIALAAVDHDIGVRAVAAEAEPHFTAARTARACAVWRSVVAAGDKMGRHVIYAIHALARARDTAAARPLAQLLGTLGPEIDEAASRALSVITVQTFALDPRLWNRWLDRHGDRSRIEWLIDGVARCDPSIYAFVMTELVAATGVHLGEAAVDAARERKKLHKAYRRWWKARQAR